MSPLHLYGCLFGQSSYSVGRRLEEYELYLNWWGWGVYVLTISSVQYRCPTGYRCSGSPVGRYIEPYKDNNIQWGNLWAASPPGRRPGHVHRADKLMDQMNVHCIHRAVFHCAILWIITHTILGRDISWHRR